MKAGDPVWWLETYYADLPILHEMTVREVVEGKRIVDAVEQIDGREYVRCLGVDQLITDAAEAKRRNVTELRRVVDLRRRMYERAAALLAVAEAPDSASPARHPD